MPAFKPETAKHAEKFQIDSKQSLLKILVYRGGLLSHLGHNHLISSTDITGTIYIAKQIENSGFHITLPVNSLIVDDPKLRQMQGDDFKSSVTEKAAAGTRKNMLSEYILDSNNYPSIHIISSGILSDSAISPIKTMSQITIKNITRDVESATTWKIDKNKLVANGQIELSQTDFEITPFSIMMGAIAVKDKISIYYNIVAQLDDEEF